MTALEKAARAAQHAPSVFNTQPWSWRITGDTLELYADSTRRLDTVDRDGRLLLLSCGAALHHARVALAAAGWCADVERLPDGERHPDLLARIRVTGRTAADPAAGRLLDAIARRRTDRRAFGERVVPEATLARLREMVAEQGAGLYTIPDDQVPYLAIAVDAAADVEYFGPGYRTELTRWTHRPAWTGDGIPPASAVQPALRRVPARNLLPDGSAGLLAGTGDDDGAVFVVVFGDGDAPADLLRGGEAMSALLLQATVEGVSTAPISEAVEIAWPRELLRRLLFGAGEPYLIVRMGYADSGETLPATPRRDARETIRVDE
jgi:nitroreductase